MFDDVTPIAVDCGRLCGKACCKGDDMGMYLFPGEKGVYDLLSPKWARLEMSDFTYKYGQKTCQTPIVFCSGRCDRYQRPLACRIFPLTPYITADGTLDVIIDPRAKSVCPMAKVLYLSDFDPLFVKNVKRAFSLLVKNPRIRAFMTEYSSYIDEFAKFFRS
jgi:hypothetical protein